jgi:hypothetical protein
MYLPQEIRKARQAARQCGPHRGHQQPPARRPRAQDPRLVLVVDVEVRERGAHHKAE